MRGLSIIIFSILPILLIAQGTTNVGTNTTLDVGSNAVLYMGGQAQIDGTISNLGLTVLDGDVTLNGAVTNSGQMNITGGGAFNSTYTNSGITVVDSDATLVGTIDNTGEFVIKGDGGLGGTSVFNNLAGSKAGIEGNGTLDGSLVNDGEFLVSGDALTVINGTLDNNGLMGFDTNIDVNGTIDNSGTLGVIGETTMNGTLINPLGAEASFDGDVFWNTPLNNDGAFLAMQNAVMTGDLVNTGDAIYGGTTSFDGNVTNATNANLLLGSNTSFNLALTNDGAISVYSSATLDFKANKYLGTVNVVDSAGLDPIGEVVLLNTTDSIIFTNMNMSTSGKATLPATQKILVTNELNLLSGIVNAKNQENFLVTGVANISPSRTAGNTYVEGKMVALSKNDRPVLFPMGLGDRANYMTLSSLRSGVVLKVECIEPDLSTLRSDDETWGLYGGVEWIVRAIDDTVNVAVSVLFPEVDVNNLTNASYIRADSISSTLQLHNGEEDIFHKLISQRISEDSTDPIELITYFKVDATDSVTITPQGRRFVIGVSPIQVEPLLYFPNVFAPSGQMEENRLFRPFFDGYEVTSINFRVYDSFNKIVYQTNHSGEMLDLSNIGWDGRLTSGLDAPEGVYYYDAQLTFNSLIGTQTGKTEKVSKRGSVMLVK